MEIAAFGGAYTPNLLVAAKGEVPNLWLFQTAVCSKLTPNQCCLVAGRRRVNGGKSSEVSEHSGMVLSWCIKDRLGVSVFG